MDDDLDYEYRTVGVVGSGSFCVVLPKRYANVLGVEKGDFVRVHKEDEKIIIEKDQKKFTGVR